MGVRVNAHNHAPSRIPRTYHTVGDRGPWVVRCAPGLARVAVSELRFRRALPRRAAPAILRQRNHDLLFIQRAGDRPPGPLLRVPEEVHYCLIYGRYKISQSQLQRLAATLRAQGRAFRLVVTADGAHFPRQDTRRWLAQQLQRLDVPLTEDPAWDEVLWAFCIEEAYYLCLLRCTADDAPSRRERRAERPGSLPPTIAAALAFLGEPRPGDAVLDPLCGTGTLLAEAHAYAPDTALAGIDLDGAALAAARDNLAHIPAVELLHGDGTRTGLPDRSVMLFLANLPFGKQFGARNTNPRLYRALLGEMLRLATPSDARAVLLTGDTGAFEDALAAFPQLAVSRQIPIRIRGEGATIFVVPLPPTA